MLEAYRHLMHDARTLLNYTHADLAGKAITEIKQELAWYRDDDMQRRIERVSLAGVDPAECEPYKSWIREKQAERDQAAMAYFRARDRAKLEHRQSR